MSDEPVGVSYCAFWVAGPDGKSDYSGVPASMARSMVIDDARTARETAELEAFEAERRATEMLHAVRTGRARAGLAGVFAAAERHAAAEDYQAERRAERERYGDAEVAVRHDFAATEYELSAQLDRASRLHRDLVAHRATVDYGAQLAASRAKSEGYDGA